MNLAGALEEAALHFPDRCAVIDKDQKYSYTQLNQDANRAAASLVGMGAASFDRVCLCQDNGYQWLAAYFGVLKAGCTAVTAFHALSFQELAQVLTDSKPKFLFLSGSQLNDTDISADFPFIKKIIGPGRDISFSDFLSNGRTDFKLRQMEPDDPAAVLFTGGTTGLPKGAVLTHRNIITSINNAVHQERATHLDIALCFLPLNHVFGQIHIMASTVASAGSIVLMPGFDLDAMLAAIKKYQVTRFFAVPTIYVRLLELDDLAERFSSVRYSFSAAASMPRELVIEWKNKTGLDISESYGMTESTAMVTYNHYHRHVVGSVGTQVGTIEVSIRDENGQTLDTDERGEICIRGPNVMKEYLNRPEETAAAFWGDWLRSGDVGLVDKDGYLFIVDRIKDMIITGGENVYPREVEELLYEHESVAECAVVGMPDTVYGEKVCAVIVPKAGKTVDAVDLKSFLKERLSGFKVPKEFIEVSDLPRSGAGKVLKRELRDMLIK